jgi:multicomponent Na+:H+ antiporter subunit B
LILTGAALLFYALVKGYAFVMGASGLSTGISLGTPGNLFSGGLILPLNISVGIVVFSEGEV